MKEHARLFALSIATCTRGSGSTSINEGLVIDPEVGNDSKPFGDLCHSQETQAAVADAPAVIFRYTCYGATGVVLGIAEPDLVPGNEADIFRAILVHIEFDTRAIIRKSLCKEGLGQQQTGNCERYFLHFFYV
ncbi:hypothetical protein D3C72_1417110 [compost metagenome]